MKWKVKFLLKLIPQSTKKAFIFKFGEDFYHDFSRISTETAQEFLPAVPDIGKSVFAMDYYFLICCFIWFESFKKLGSTSEEAGRNIWFICEEYLKRWPQSILRLAGRKVYSGLHQKRAIHAVKMGELGMLHPFDWKIQYKEFDKNTFQFDIFECGAMKLAHQLKVEDIFPYLCRMDYMTSHYMGIEFKRTGTLADGCNCCDAWFRIPGHTNWPVPIDIEGVQQL